MDAVQKIALEALNNPEHYELAHSILEFAEKCALITEDLAKWFAPYQSAVQEEERIFGISLRSDLTEPLDMTDRERDGLVTGSKAIANALEKNPSEAMQNAAREVMNQFISLKVDTKGNYLEESGQIDNLVNTLQTSYAPQLELLGLTKPIQLLKAANDRMHDLLNERDLKQYGRMNGALETARTETDKAFRALIDAFNAYTLLNSDALQQDDKGARLFITEANSKLDYFKRYALKGSAGSKPTDKPDTDVPDTDAPDNTNPGDNNNPGDTKPGDDNTSNPGAGDNNQGNDNGNQGDNNEGNNGNYPPGYDPDADDDPGV